MEPLAATSRLRAHARVIEALVTGVGEQEARWRPDEDQWSILEVVNHLADEEFRDFRTRVDLTLHHPARDWPAIDPPRWVVEERYGERDLTVSLGRFLRERATSLDYLEGLGHPAWDRAYEHPVMGSLRASDLLAAWVLHDHIHIRQLNRLRGAYWRSVAASGQRTEYAGEW